MRTCITFTILLVAVSCGKRAAPARGHGQRDSAVVNADARPAQTTASLRTLDDGRCGYVDKSGQLAIRKRFDRAGEFSAGLAAVSKNRKTGFIDGKGDYAIAPTFDAAKAFRDGLAAVCVDGKGWGYIDAKGAWVIAPSFAYGDSFVDGIAVVKGGGELRGACANGGAREIPEGSECESGIAVDPDDGSDNDDDEGAGQRGGAPAGQFYLVDRTGRRLHDKGYHCITRMSEGLAAARWKDKWGYLNRDGQEAIAPRFVRAKPFGEGWAAVFLTDRAQAERGTDGEGKWGFIDRRGRFVTQVKYRATEVGSFSQGLVAMEGLPLKSLLSTPTGRACASPDEPSRDPSAEHDNPISCGVYLDKRGSIRLAVPYCPFDDSPAGFRSFRDFSGGLAEVVAQEPIHIQPYACAPALMDTVSTFVDQHGKLQPAANAVIGRAPDGLVAKCDGEQANQNVRPFVWR